MRLKIYLKKETNLDVPLVGLLKECWLKPIWRVPDGRKEDSVTMPIWNLQNNMQLTYVITVVWNCCQIMKTSSNINRTIMKSLY